ncbi:MAG: hypothetical protein B6244_12590 [Candidatus Cloacimonetes bacterium 4572_55]|nr:MAG: hypothetical protein B6244_12590 [Candidatus Cloacimonetes bacterium 4572_55]
MTTNRGLALTADLRFCILMQPKISLSHHFMRKFQFLIMRFFRLFRANIWLFMAIYGYLWLFLDKFL